MKRSLFPPRVPAQIEPEEPLENEIQVEILDDGSSSLCIDELEAEVDIEDAVDAINQISDKRELNDYEKYTQRVAKDFIEREKLSRRRMRGALPTLSARQADPTSITRERGQVEFVENRSQFGNSMASRSIVSDSDLESLITVDIDTGEDLFAPRKAGLKRQLRSKDLKFIMFAGGIGLTLFLETSRSVNYSGPLGTMLGFMIGAVIVLSILTSLAEMIAFWPSEGSFAGFVDMYVDRSLAFAVGICYWLQCSIAVPYEILSSVSLVSVFPDLNVADYNSVVWLTFFMMIVVSVNFLSVSLIGRTMASLSMICGAIMLMIIVYMFCLNTGKVGPLYEYLGFRYWREQVVNGVQLGPFPQTFGDRHISGSLGRFLMVCSSITTALASYVGTGVLYTPMAEIRNPRRTIPSTVRVMYVRILVFFIIGIFAVLLNLYTGDDLLRSDTSYGTAQFEILSRHFTCGLEGSRWRTFDGFGSTSPWMIACLQRHVCYGVFASAAFFIFSGVFGAMVRLFAATRTLHGLGATRLCWRQLAACTRDGVPYVSLIISSAIAMTAYISIGVDITNVFQFLEKWVLTSSYLVWSSVCLAYVRFYKALERTPGLDRNEHWYPYRAPFQPYTAIFGGIMSMFWFLFSAIPYELGGGSWQAADTIAFYCPLFVFLCLFLVHKFYFQTSIVPLESINLIALNSHMDNEEWEEDRVYSDGFRESLRDTSRRLTLFARKQAQAVRSTASKLVSREKML